MFTEKFMFTIKVQEYFSTCGWSLNVAQVSELGLREGKNRAWKGFRDFSEMLSVKVITAQTKKQKVNSLIGTHIWSCAELDSHHPLMLDVNEPHEVFSVVCVTLSYFYCTVFYVERVHLGALWCIKNQHYQQ